MGSAARIVVPILVIALLAAAGVIDLSLLPWEDTDFRVTLACIAIYLVWSVLESGSPTESSRITLYAVLLVSVIDSFLLRLTVFHGLFPLRWAGAILLAAGCAARIYGLRREKENLLRWGRAMQMPGLAVGLGSISGIVLSVFPGIPSSMGKNSR